MFLEGGLKTNGGCCNCNWNGEKLQFCHGNCSLFCLGPLTSLSLSFSCLCFPLCHWQGVEKLVHYFCDKAWYSTTSDLFPSPPHAFSLLGFFFALCMMHVCGRCACSSRIFHCIASLLPQDTAGRKCLYFILQRYYIGNPDGKRDNRSKTEGDFQLMILNEYLCHDHIFNFFNS